MPMNDDLKTILRRLNRLSQIEPNDEAARRALANVRERLVGSGAEPARPLLSKPTRSFLRSRTMYPRVAAVVLACAAIIAILVVLNSSGGPGQLAFAQVIEKVEKTQSLTFRTKNEGPGGHAEDEMQIIVLPDGKMRAENSKILSIQDLKAHRMLLLFKERKTAQVIEGFSPPSPAAADLNVYEMIRNIRKDAVERLPDEEIDGRKTIVFRVELKGLPKVGNETPRGKIWVDPQTELPIRIEAVAEDENEKPVTSVMYDIEFDQPFDPAIFDLAPPKDYSVQTGGVANFPDLPEKADLTAPEIIPGVGLGPIRFGMLREKIESLLGKPDGYEGNKTNLLYYSRGFTLSVSKRSGLKGIHCTSQTLTMNRVRDFVGKTKEGIGIGSSLEEVGKAFGKADRDEGVNSFNKRLAYDKYGLEIQFVDDKVIMIDMNEIRSQVEESPNERKDAAEQQSPKMAGRTLKINVVGPDGKPVPGVKIRDGIWSKEMTAKTNNDHVCDAQGQTVIELPSTFDILRLFTRCDGYVPLFTHWEQLDEDPPDAYTIKLTTGTLIGGVVKDEEGRPIVGAKVEVMMAHDPAANRKRTCFTAWLAEGDDARTTDVEGRWTLDNVPAGDVKLTLKVSHPDYQSDADWGGLQKEQKMTLEELRKQKATLIMQRKK
jgi:outer membrane lipoprotein-sorting protein